MVAWSLIVAGSIFPLIALMSFVASAVASRRGRRESPVFVPFIGPILLDAGLLVAGHRSWLLALPWMCDLGTVAFMVALPRLLRDWWETSSFTRILILDADQGHRRVLRATGDGTYVVEESGVSGTHSTRVDARSFTLTRQTSRS